MQAGPLEHGLAQLSAHVRVFRMLAEVVQLVRVVFEVEQPGAKPLRSARYLYGSSRNTLLVRLAQT